MVAFPRTLPAVRWTSFPLDLERFVSSSQSGNRLTNVVEYADPLWRATLTTKAVHHLGLRPVEAWWSSLREGLRTVLYRHPSYSCPAAHIRARGPEAQSGVLASVSSGNVCIVNGVSPALVLQAGDFVSFSAASGKALGRVVECEGSGTSRTIMVEPPLPRGYPAGARVRFDRAELHMRPVPRSFTIEGSSVRTASFQLIESMTARGALAIEVGVYDDARQGVAYQSQAPAVINGEDPYVFAIASGSLPDGLSLNAATGVISGKPARNGTSSFTLRVTDADGRVATAASRTIIARPPAFIFAGGQVVEPATVRAAATASVVGPDRVLRLVNANELRWDHDPLTGASRGALIEPASTNLMLRSEAWTTSPWAIGGSYFRQMEAGDHPNLAPGFQVCRYGPTAGSSSFSGNVVRQERSDPFAPGWYTTYADFKAVGAATSVRMLHVPILTADTGQVGGVIDLTNGAVLADNMASGNTFGPVQQFYSVPLGNGWFRVVIVFEVVREFSRLNWRAFPYISTSQLVGDGSSGLLATMAQFEAGATPTSYVPTTTAAVTRAADQVSFQAPILSTARFTFDDGSTATRSVPSGAFTIPTDLPRRHIRRINLEASA